jgi:regulator of protease activity HflC (stomatin/prohibitin superfamily)
VARATAESLQRIAEALQTEGGTQAMQLRIAEQYLTEFGNLAKEGNTFVVPANLSDLASMIALATGIARADGPGPSSP